MPSQPARRGRIGVLFDRDRQPEVLAEFARGAEDAGADDLWLVEDLGWAGSIASAATALAVTRRIRVGIGIVPAPLRNTALLAMELATLARIHPGRFVPGVGHGIPEWMAQVGAGTERKLALLEETITAVRSLLRGETVQVSGRAVRLDGISLVHPPAVPPPVVSGVVRPRSLELSGRVADGTIISEGHGPAGVAAALAHIEKGRAAGTGAPHEVIVFAFHHVDDDPDRVRTATGDVVAGQANWLGIAAAEVFLAAGSADVVARRVHSLWEAGAHTVVLRPIGPDPLGQVRASLAALERTATASP